MSDRFEERSCIARASRHEADNSGAICWVKDVPMFEDLLRDFRLIEEQQAASGDADGCPVSQKLEEQSFEVRRPRVDDLPQRGTAALCFGFGIKSDLPELIESAAIAKHDAKLANQRP